MRLLDPGDRRPSLAMLGLGGALGAELELALDREHGLFLVTGPTGSGKTTTLYAVLESRDRVGRNILTLEDPVESRLAGVTQVQVQPRAGLTFAAALRSVLRQDPDVIMVGEMRDGETAETGLAAALTGHLVLSTLHTIDAPGAVSRLVEMGAPRYLVAGGLVGVLAQRLVRRLCPDCRTVVPAGQHDLARLGLPTPIHLPRAVGCDRCGGTGYRGRVGIFELLRVDAAVRELILEGAPTDAIREAAAAAGMIPLPLDAWSRVEAGLTTLEEVRPLLTLLADAAAACRSCGSPLGRGHLFCPLCGGGVTRRCACGAAAGPHWRFCGACGVRLSAVEGVGDLAQ
jgi:type II secretory ATPase GspE/PulE/Tfp pilus assembly ATPase PilB-like protein